MQFVHVLPLCKNNFVYYLFIFLIASDVYSNWPLHFVFKARASWHTCLHNISLISLLWNRVLEYADVIILTKNIFDSKTLLLLYTFYTLSLWPPRARINLDPSDTSAMAEERERNGKKIESKKRTHNSIIWILFNFSVISAGYLAYTNWMKNQINICWWGVPELCTEQNRIECV